MQRWEYERSVLPSNEHLEALGRDGWELVSVVYEHEAGVSVYVFKRPLPKPRRPYSRGGPHLEDLG